MKNTEAIVEAVAIAILFVSWATIVLNGPVHAASTSDSSVMGIKAADSNANSNPTDINSTSSDNNNINPADLKTTGSTEAQDTSGLNGLVLTAVPEKAVIKAGDIEGIHIKAATDNGTALKSLPVTVLIQDYQTGKQKAVLGGKTDDKGELDVSASIGTHAKTSQFIAIVTADKDNKNSKVSTGFVVNEKDTAGSSSGSGSGSSSGRSGSGSGSSGDSGGRCSGSSCK